jgi:predicted molibdopterin-dependent oxidoreductase YjgC
VVLPITNVAEEDGTFVNRDGRVQRFFQAKAAPGMARPAWWVLGELLSELDLGESFTDSAEAFERMADIESAFAGLSYQQIGYRGAVIEGAHAAGVPR